MYMRKITKLLLTAALLVVGVGGVNATKKYADLSSASAVGGNVGNAEGTIGGWESSSSGGYVFTWKGSWDARIVITDIAGYISSYEKMIIECPEFSDAWRVDVEFTYGGTKTIGGAYYSVSNKTIILSDVLSSSERNSIANIRINTASGAGSLRITKLYLEKPMSLSWNDDGTADIDFTDLTASNGFTLNDQTGELTGTGSSGSLSINFPATGVDLSALTGFSVTYTGDNLFGNFEVGNGTMNKGFWSSVTGRDDLNQHMTAANVGDPTAITNWKWNNNSTAGTMTISSIKLKGRVIKANPSGEVAVETLERKYYEGGVWKTGTVNYSYGSGIGTPIGDGNSTQDEYIELSNYNEIRLYVSSGDVRIFVVKADGFTPSEDGYIITKDGVKQNGQWGGVQDTDHKLVKNGDYYYITVSDIKAACGGQAKLIGVKAEYGQSVNISKIIVVEDSEFNYSVSGSGSFSTSVITALADANATCIDATGITAATVLASANPNCLITANAGMVTNANNVIVSGNCDNLVLTDGYAFKAPFEFTAAATSYSRNFSDFVNKTTTVCLPFALTASEASAFGTFYELDGFNGSTLHFTSVEAPVANTPYLVLPTTASLSLNETNKTIVATPASLGKTESNVEFVGTLAATAIPASDESVSYYAYNNGSLVKIVNKAATLPAFRAYFKVTENGNPSRNLSISFYESETTGISQIEDGRLNIENCYDLQGRRIESSIQKKGLYIVNGKKVIK